MLDRSGFRRPEGDSEIAIVADYTRKSTIMNREQHLLVRLLLIAPVSAALVFSMLVVAGTHAGGQEKEVLPLETHIPLPSVKGRIDHFSVDVKGCDSLWPLLKPHTRSR